MDILFKPCVYRGGITPPPSKSISHRALICAALCDGKRSVIKNVSLCDDVLATIECLKSLGAEIKIKGNTIEVNGNKLHPANKPLDCKDSASTIRFLMPLAMLFDSETIFTGSIRLLERPLDVYEEICEEQRLLFEIEETSIKVCGKMSPGFFKIKDGISSQYVSGLMMALSCLKTYSVIETEDIFVSFPYILMTAQIMKTFGMNVTVNDNRIVIDGTCEPHGVTMTVENDWSSCAYLMGFNMTGSEIDIGGCDDNSIQGDKLARSFFGKIRRGFARIDITDTPDLFPILAVVAPLYYGAEFIGTERLRYKESDRVVSLVEELKKFEIDALVEDDSVTVYKSELRAPDEKISSHNDHRIAMAMSVLLSITGGTLSGVECVSKSYPGFFDILNEIKDEEDI